MFSWNSLSRNCGGNLFSPWYSWQRIPTRTRTPNKFSRCFTHSIYNCSDNFFPGRHLLHFISLTASWHMWDTHRKGARLESSFTMRWAASRQATIRWQWYRECSANCPVKGYTGSVQYMANSSSLSRASTLWKTPATLERRTRRKVEAKMGCLLAAV